MPDIVPHNPLELPSLKEFTRSREDSGNGKNSLLYIREYIQFCQNSLNKHVLQGKAVELAVKKRAWLVDQALIYLWQQAHLVSSDAMTLLAVGGYGRGELHPHSDVDILILLRENNPHFDPSIESFLTNLWDIGLTIGHSVRSLDECLESARDDLTIATSLMEARIITGSPVLLDALNQAIAPDQIWSDRAFFKAKLDEQNQRHSKSNFTECNVEPDLKKAPGGLRDIHTIGWVAKRHFGVNDLTGLVNKGFISNTEYQTILDGQNFIWLLRYHLHLITGRGENRLLFDYQTQLAQKLGYVDNEQNLAVEQLMKRYYRTALAISQLNELLLQLFNELILEDASSRITAPLNEHFQLTNDAIEVTHPLVFEKHPPALLEIFYIIANHKEINKVRASTIRLIQDHAYLIDETFRTDPRNNRIFMNFLRSPYNIFSQLKRMKRYGILGRYIPAFGEIIGQSQFDLFHIYTVDAHTLLVIKNMRRFRLRTQQQQFPIAYSIVQQLPKLELLYLSGLFHDIGKGRGGDHSKLGAQDCRNFCIQHGLSRADTDLLIWLVENHLLMSMTAQKKDINDPDVIQQFSERVGDELRLDYLYGLTVADICATNPELWNSWRATLMRELYQEAKHVFRRGIENAVDSSDRIIDKRNEALLRLKQDSHRDLSLQASAIWDNMSDDYFLRESANDIAWHTQGILNHQSSKPLILIKQTTSRKFEGGTQIFIYTEDQPNLFAVMVATLEQLQLSVVDARIITSRSNFSLDTYIVLDEDGSPIGKDPYRISVIQKTLEKALENPAVYPQLVTQHIPRQRKNFKTNTHIKLHDSNRHHYSILEVNTLDRPGLLAQIGRFLSRMHISVLNARITTLGERADDIFFVVNQEGQPFAQKELGRLLQKELCQSLDQLCK